ncbi:MAG: DUF6441 family protein [Candidatus Zixiibacteriota bacterium]
MRFEAAIRGNLNQVIAAELKSAEIAVTAGVKEVTLGLKEELRTDIRRSGLGDRLAKAVRSKLFPKGKKSINAAGFIFSKAPKLHNIFSKGGVIRPTSKKLLAVPLDNVPKQGKRRLTPATWPRNFPLKFVKRKGKPPLLVAEGIAATSGATVRKGTDKQRARGKRATSVPMFILVPKVTIKKRFEFEKTAAKWINRLPDLILKNWPETKEIRVRQR